MDKPTRTTADFRVGQVLYRVPLSATLTNNEPATVTKVARKWVTVKLGHTGYATRRIDPITMIDDEKGPTKARYWLSEEAYEESLREKGDD